MKIKTNLLPAEYSSENFNSGTCKLNTIKFSSSGLLAHLPEKIGKTGWPWNEECDPKIYTKKADWPKITIVTPSYNQGAFLEQTIRSVLLQNYPNLEYIVIDGGSSDNSREILEKYNHWISYWHSKKDNGQSHAINQGLNMASGEYYGWINSDDYYTEQTFSQLVTKITENKNKTFFYGWGYSLEMVNGNAVFHQQKPRYQFKRYIRIPNLIQPSCFWHKSIHEPIWEELVCSMDFELWVRIFPKSNPYYIKDYLSVATIHDDAKTYNEHFKKHWQDDHEKIINRHGAFTYFSWKKIMFELKILSLIKKLYRN